MALNRGNPARQPQRPRTEADLADEAEFWGKKRTRKGKRETKNQTAIRTAARKMLGAAPPPGVVLDDVWACSQVLRTAYARDVTGWYAIGVEAGAPIDDDIEETPDDEENGDG